MAKVVALEEVSPRPSSANTPGVEWVYEASRSARRLPCRTRHIKRRLGPEAYSKPLRRAFHDRTATSEEPIRIWVRQHASVRLPQALLGLQYWAREDAQCCPGCSV